MPNRTSCQIHIPHKANMQDWASELAHLLFPNDPVQAAKLGNLARADHENWESLERFLNQVAPNCFGGEGCGTPSSVLTVPNGNVVDGEDACAEGRDNTVHGDKSTVISGQDNENDGENCTISGESNTIPDSGGAQYLDSAIIGGFDNNLESDTSAIIAGNTNSILDNPGGAVILGGDHNSIDAANTGVILGGFGNVNTSGNGTVMMGAANGADPGAGTYSLVMGTGGCPWQDSTFALGIQSATFDTGLDGHIRPSNQHQIFGYSTNTLDATPYGLGFLSILDYPSAFKVTGNIVARRADSDVASFWSYTALLSSDTTGARLVVPAVVTLDGQDAGAALWAFGLTVAAGGGAPFTNDLVFTVTGDAAHTVYWTATGHMDEVYVPV